MIQNKHEKALPNKKADIVNIDDNGQQRRQARKRRQGRSGASNQASEQLMRLITDKSGVEESDRAQNPESNQPKQRRKQNQSKKIDVFEPHQTKILQKWFLDNIQRPYVKPVDKELLAQQTGLNGKQISGWFTNNRKRKYSKVLEAAKKRNKDFNYVRDVMRVKFDRNLDQSSSMSGQSQSSFSLNKQLRSDKWNLRSSSKDGLDEQNAEDSADQINEVASQKRRRGKSNARSNLIKTLPFLENDEVDGLKKQKSPDKANVEQIDMDQSEDTVQKSQIEEKSEVDGQNRATLAVKQQMKSEAQDALLDATPCQAKEKFEMPLPKTIISDQNQWSPLKFMTSLGKTMDRINETATRASLSGMRIDPRSYQSQLLQNLQGEQAKAKGTKIEYFTIRNQDEEDQPNLRNDGLAESQNQAHSPQELLNQQQKTSRRQNEMKERDFDQIVDRDKSQINIGSENGRQNGRADDQSRQVDAGQDANAAVASQGQLKQQQNVEGSRNPSQDDVSGQSVEMLKQFDARIHKKQEVEKLCQQVKFIPIVLMWCPNLLAGQHCSCGIRSLSTVPNIKEQARAFLNMVKCNSKKVQKSIHLNCLDLEPIQRQKGYKATQMDKNINNQQIDSGTQINEHNNIQILKEQTNQSSQNKVPRAHHAGGYGSRNERRDGKDGLDNKVKSAYDQENIIKNEGQNQGGSDHFQTNIDFGANQDNEDEIGHNLQPNKSCRPGPLITSANRTKDVHQMAEQDATGLAKQQGKMGQLRGHEQYQESSLAKFSPPFQEQHKISPVDVKKEGSALTQFCEQEFHQSNKLGHMTQVDDGGGHLLRSWTAMRAADNDQHSPFRQQQTHYAADIDFDRKKFRTQQVKKEQGLGVQEDLLEEAKESYSSLEPRIQSLFQKLLLRIMDEHESSPNLNTDKAGRAFQQQDQQIEDARPDAQAAVISKSETPPQVLDDKDTFIGSKEREAQAQKQTEMNLLTHLILKQITIEGGQQLMEAQLQGLGSNQDQRAALSWHLINGLTQEQNQVPQSAKQYFNTKQSLRLQKNAQILQNEANLIPSQREMPLDEHKLLPRQEALKTDGHPKDQREGHQVFKAGKQPSAADRQCSDPQTELYQQKHSNFSMGGAFNNQSDPNNNSGQSAHSGQNVDGNVGSGNGGSSDQRQEAVNQQIKDKNPHAGGDQSSNPSNLNPSNNPGSQTSSSNRQKKGKRGEDPPEQGARAGELHEEGEEARSDKGILCCNKQQKKRLGIKQHKNLSNDVHQQKNEQSHLNELRDSQEAPIHGITSGEGEGKDSNDKNNSRNDKTVGVTSAPQLDSNNAFKFMILNDSGVLGSASINNKKVAQPPMKMVMADEYTDGELVAGPHSSLRAPTVPVLDRSNQKTNSDPTKDDNEQQNNSINNNAMTASAKEVEMINTNNWPKKGGREGQVPRHQTAQDLRYRRESQKRVTENKVMNHMCDIQNTQHQNQMRSQDQQEDYFRMHTRGANLNREAIERRRHRHHLDAIEERRRSLQTGRAANDTRQNVHRQSFVLPHPGYQPEGQAGIQQNGSYSMMANSHGGQPNSTLALNVDSVLAQNPMRDLHLMQPEQKQTNMPTANNRGQLPPFSGPSSQLSNPRVENNNIQSAPGPSQNQDGGRGAPPANEPGAALNSSQDWLRSARHNKPVHAAANCSNYLHEAKPDGQAFLGSSPARINMLQPPAFAQNLDPRMQTSNIPPPVNMIAESQMGPLAQDGCRVGPLLGSGGQVLNISYPLQQINYIPIEVLHQQQTQPRVTSPYLYNPQGMLVNPTMGSMADVSGNLHPRQMNEKLGEVLSHSHPNPGNLLRPELYGSMQGQPQPHYTETSSMMQQNPHHQPSLTQQNQLRGHQMKMGPIDQQMQLNPYNTVQDHIGVYNAQQEIYPQHPQGHARMNQFAQQSSQTGGSPIKIEEQHARVQHQQIQNMELQQVLTETQHVILKQLNQINSHSRHLLQSDEDQGQHKNNEDGGNARAQAEMTDSKATAERRKEGYQQRNQSQLQPTKQLPVGSPHATRRHYKIVETFGQEQRQPATIMVPATQEQALDQALQEQKEIQKNITQLFELMGQQQSLYQTLVAQKIQEATARYHEPKQRMPNDEPNAMLASTANPSGSPQACENRLAAHGALGTQQINGQRMDLNHSIQYMQSRERAPSQVMADREAHLQAQNNGDQHNISRNFDELFEIPQHILTSRHDSARVRQSQGSGPNGLGKNTNGS